MREGVSGRESDCTRFNDGCRIRMGIVASSCVPSDFSNFLDKEK